MKSLFKSMGLALIAVMMIANAGVASADAFDDMLRYYPEDIEDSWGFEALDQFVNADLLQGYIDEEGTVTLRPEAPVKRAEFVAILVRALGLTKAEASAKSFTDVKQTDWFYEPVSIASSLGIVNGKTETTFGPNLLVTRGEIAAIVVRAFQATVKFEEASAAPAFTDVPAGYFAAGYISQASQAEIIKGKTATQFQPNSPAKRVEAVTMLQRALAKQDSALPEDAALLAVVEEASKSEANLLEAKKYGELDALYKKQSTGYMLALNLLNLEFMEYMIEDGGRIDFSVVTEPTFTVVSKTNRFAVVKTEGGVSHQVVVDEEGEEIMNDDVPLEGELFLKLMPDNSWKIYNTTTESKW
ncbi:S-layer homology domain-containing protein [Paenibacillus sp. GCM10023252]|uniref:S-layer homology domain-containing protein n=1 Tax=Paenibacillus sp. GCM10023252 TaxID=3252649 RepID=UPI00361086CF